MDYSSNPIFDKQLNKKNIRFSKKSKNKTSDNISKYNDAKEKVDKAIEKKERKNIIKVYWIIPKINQNDCPIPSHILGQHYSQVADKLVNELPNVLPDDIATSSSSFDNINIKSTLNGFSFVSTTNREIYELILQLGCSKGPGTDEIDIKSLRSVANIIAPHLALLFNQSILEGIYPQCFKTARCVPIFKGFLLDPSLPVNYRPISILTAINKVFERILHRQLVNYLEQNRLLPCFQYGYRKNHNNFNNYLSKALADKNITIAIFMDLSKAFDTVDKTILSRKLNELGISDISTALINSYMSNRRFYIDKSNKVFKLNYVVPQGSILGPLIFIVYIYDMMNIKKENKMIVYADDTTVLVKGRNLTETKQHCNDILQRFYDYFCLNKLSVNPSKTKYIIYKPKFYGNKNKKLLFDTTNTKLSMADSLLEEVSIIKFLGIMINIINLHGNVTNNKFIIKYVGIW